MPLSPDQIAAYHRDGFVTARGVFAAEAAELKKTAASSVALLQQTVET